MSEKPAQQPGLWLEFVIGLVLTYLFFTPIKDGVQGFLKSLL